MIIVNLSGFEKGEGKDAAMASARLLGASYFQGKRGMNNVAFARPFLEGDLFSSSGGASSLSLHLTPRGKNGGK